MLQRQSAEQVLRRDELSRSADTKLATPSVQSQLLGFVKKCFSDASLYRQSEGVDEMLLDAMRRRKGEYAPDVLAKYKAQGNSTIWIPLTEQKCNAAEAWMSDVLMPYGDRIWTVQPTTIPALKDEVVAEVVNEVVNMAQAQLAADPTFQPDEDWARGQAEVIRAQLEGDVKEEAVERANKMADQIQDQLEESDWFGVFKDFLSNVVTYGTGLLKGPVVRPTPKLVWEGNTPVVQKNNDPGVEAPNPLDIYPSPRSSDVPDGFIIERIRTERASISALRELPYYQTAEIDRLLTDHPDGLVTTQATDAERATLERKPDASATRSDREVELFEFWGPIPGKYLREWGIPEAKDTEDYEFQVIWSSEYVLKVMPNPDPLGRRPYHKAPYKRVVGSFWGKGIPTLMKASQDRANAAQRAIVDNMGLCAGPQIVVDVARLPAGERVTHIYPRKVWLTTNENNLTTKPVDFFQPESNVAELTQIYASAVQDAELESGVPAYNYGSDQVSGAGRTVSGLSMLMNASARGIKESFSNIDQKGVGPLIERFYVWNMLYNPDESIKGDLQVVTRGATGTLLREMTLQKTTEFLDRTNNATDMQIIGIEGRAKVLRKSAELLNIGVEDVVPSEDELEQKIREAMLRQQQAPPQMGMGQPQPSQPPGANYAGTQPRQESAEVPIPPG